VEGLAETPRCQVPKRGLDASPRKGAGGQGIERTIPVFGMLELSAGDGRSYYVAEFFPGAFGGIGGVKSSGHRRGFAVTVETVGVQIDDDSIFLGDRSGTDPERFEEWDANVREDYAVNLQWDLVCSESKTNRLNVMKCDEKRAAGSHRKCETKPNVLKTLKSYPAGRLAIESTTYKAILHPALGISRIIL
jgi:hypothetical protein